MGGIDWSFYGQFYDPDEVEGRARAIHTVQGMVKMSRMWFIYGGKCRPSVYIDGRRFRRGIDFWRWVDIHAKPAEVEGVEIYRPLNVAIPTEFRDADSSRCGAIVIWRKRARG